MISEKQVTEVISAVAPELHPCETCGAPMDQRQRYCLECGDRRRHGDDPAARYLSGVAGRRRGQLAAAALPAAPVRERTFPASLLAAIVAIPLALGGGVLIGRSPSDGSQAALLSALRAQKPPVIQISGGGSASASTAATTLPRSAASQGKAASNPAKVISRTALGTAHQVTGTKPTQTQLAQGAQIARKDAQSIGQQASGTGLPDVVAVP